MTSHCNARARLALQPLTETTLARELRRILPRKNNDSAVNYADLLAETRHFGINTNRQFRAFMLRHREAVVAADREPLTPQLEKIYREEWGDAVFAEKMNRGVFWNWEGMVRLALGFEFGDKYERFKRERYAV